MISDWRLRGRKRRDERQTKVPEIRPPGGSKKDTKKWCQGKVGTEHKPVCEDYAKVKGTTWGVEWKVLICSECRKELAHYWPTPHWWSVQRPKPDWVK